MFFVLDLSPCQCPHSVVHELGREFRRSDSVSEIPGLVARQTPTVSSLSTATRSIVRLWCEFARASVDSGPVRGLGSGSKSGSASASGGGRGGLGRVDWWALGG